MRDYLELSEKISTIRENTSQFIKAAFHVHSPESHDWPKSEDLEINDKETFLKDENLFLDELANRFDIVCITDHMKTNYACKLAHASIERDDITVFPGMEVNCVLGDGLNNRIHILTIFPPDKTVNEIDRIFSGNPSNIPDEAHRDGQEEFVLEDQQLDEWADTIRKSDGIMILAHIDQTSRGHRAHFRAMKRANLKMFVSNDDGLTVEEQKDISEQYKSIIYKSEVDAIEVMKSEDKQHYVEFSLNGRTTGEVPCVLRSDFHSIEEFDQDDYITYVKVSKSNFDHVKEALKFFNTRIKFANEIPSPPPNKILGVRIINPSRKGLFEDETIGFSDNLNCLIGPRGSGKSTIIEALRYVFGQNKKLIRSGDDGIIDYSGLAKKIQEHNLEDSIIEVIYQDENAEKICLRATFDKNESFNSNVYELNGDEKDISEKGINSKYPIRIFSWSEIENLGRQPKLQRKLIDRQIPELSEQHGNLESYYNNLVENKRKILNKCDDLDFKTKENDGILLRFSERKSDFDRLNTKEISVLFDTYDKQRSQKNLLEDVKNKLQEFRDKLEETEDLEYEEFKTEKFEDEYNNIKEWWEDTVDDRINISELENLIEESIEESITKISERIQKLDQEIENVNELIKGSKKAIQESIETDSEEEVKANQRETAKERYEESKEIKEKYDDLYEELEELLKERDKICSEIISTKDEITQRRVDSKKEMNSSLNDLRIHGDSISIQFLQDNDKKEMSQYMREKDFLNREQFGQYKANQIAKKISRIITPIALGSHILHKDISTLHEKREEALDENNTNDVVGEDNCLTLIEHFYPFSANENFESTEVNKSKLEKVLELQEMRWDDEIKILLDDSPVDQLSPGQRSSAMLPLIALSEDSPLIIDQPEDNLDNRMVGKTLNKVLAELKEKRQIIVATHNPNIVVGGDAEQVVVLDAPQKDKATIKKMGSIDDDEIIKSVINLMEGGKEAFNIRKQRYAPYINNLR